MASKVQVDKIARASGTPEFTIPTADGAANTFLKTDGSGVLSFGAVTTTALTGSTNTWIPTITAANALTGTANFTYDGNILDVKNSGTASSIKLYCESSNAHYQAIKAAPHAGSSDWTLTLPGAAPTVSGQVLSATTAGVASWVADAGGLFSGYAVFEDQKTSGTDGGTFTNGAWRTRDLNTTVFNTDTTNIVLGTNQFTLKAPGSYLVKWKATALEVDEHISVLYDVTGTADIEFGSSQDTQPTITITNASYGATRVTPSGSNVYEIRHRCNSTEASHGFGDDASLGVNSYCLVKIYKEA